MHNFLYPRWLAIFLRDCTLLSEISRYSPRCHAILRDFYAIIRNSTLSSDISRYSPNCQVILSEFSRISVFAIILLHFARFSDILRSFPYLAYLTWIPHQSCNFRKCRDLFTFIHCCLPSANCFTRANNTMISVVLIRVNTRKYDDVIEIV